MKASEGKLGRVFVLRLEDGDAVPEALERFAAANGILAAQVTLAAESVVAGVLAPGPDGTPRLRLTNDPGKHSWADCEAVVQEILEVAVQRLPDPRSGRDTLARVIASKTRVMEEPAPLPDETSPGTVPVYLVNAEFN